MLQKDRKIKKQPSKTVIFVRILIIIVVIISITITILYFRNKRIRIEKFVENIAINTEEAVFGMITPLEMYITFFSHINLAEFLKEEEKYEAALLAYEDAGSIASALSYNKGISSVESGIDEVNNIIIALKYEEALKLIIKGNELYDNDDYRGALSYFYDVLFIYKEIDDRENEFLTKARIEYIELKIIESETEKPPVIITRPGDEDETEINRNYLFNMGIYFDLKTPVDNQHREPASLMRMGNAEGMNEGWYNGCGWIAIYNALIILENPLHPAEIIKFFEESGGVAFDGMFGTYPNSIEAFFDINGYDVSHTAFPQVTMNIDNVISESKVCILAYLHTRAAHYIAIEYREEDDMFVVYNDSLARARSASLGFENASDTGAVIDSVAELIRNTPDILFSFSLITVT